MNDPLLKKRNIWDEKESRSSCFKIFRIPFFSTTYLPYCPWNDRDQSYRGDGCPTMSILAIRACLQSFIAFSPCFIHTPFDAIGFSQNFFRILWNLADQDLRSKSTQWGNHPLYNSAVTQLLEIQLLEISIKKANVMMGVRKRERELRWRK